MALSLKEFLHFIGFLIIATDAATISSKEAYIVYMGERTHDDPKVAHAQSHSTLTNVLGSSEDAANSMMHTYKRSFRGFSAMLTQHHADQLKRMDGVVSVFRSKSYKLHTTRSWKFSEQIQSIQNHRQQQQSYFDHRDSFGSEVIIGMLDTGIWPESESFSDFGMPPVPSRWKGICQEGDQFSSKLCNRKLIGARFYTAGFDQSDAETQKTFIKSARDHAGHGTHTSSTAAGRVVENVSFPGGIGAGTARGGSPNSRIATYKVCWDDCKDADMLAAFDDAVADGVDIISMSIGSDPPQGNYFSDSISIGSFHANQKGILVSCSAGNAGPDPLTASNLSPWILTVAASSIDRKFSTSVLLGNHVILQGQAINPSTTEFFPLVLGSDVPAPGVSAENASFCHASTLHRSNAKGKIVVCVQEVRLESRGQKSLEVHLAGGAGMIVIDDITKEIAQVFLVPGTIIGLSDGAVLLEYLKTVNTPVAKFLKTKTLLHKMPSPTIATFSSRGPNFLTPEIIKPDISGPGVTILAAWAPIAALQAGNRTVNYNFQSGTSMSCPHVSGTAAILKANHPNWSPAMIKSAIMTTAIDSDNTYSSISQDFFKTAASPFDMGSGHINPVGAVNPGLVYDITHDEYVSFLCGIGATPPQLNNITTGVCSSKLAPYNLNYPSIGLADLKGTLSITRTVTNVGKAKSYYKSKLQAPNGIEVTVTPSSLNFEYEHQKIEFTVSFCAKKITKEFVYGSLTWTDGEHFVRSPIAVNATAI